MNPAKNKVQKIYFAFDRFSAPFCQDDRCCTCLHYAAVASRFTFCEILCVAWQKFFI